MCSIQGNSRSSIAQTCSSHEVPIRRCATCAHCMKQHPFIYPCTKPLISSKPLPNSRITFGKISIYFDILHIINTKQLVRSNATQGHNSWPRYLPSTPVFSLNFLRNTFKYTLYHVLPFPVSCAIVVCMSGSAEFPN